MQRLAIAALEIAGTGPTLGIVAVEMTGADLVVEIAALEILIGISRVGSSDPGFSALETAGAALILGFVALATAGVGLLLEETASETIGAAKMGAHCPKHSDSPSVPPNGACGRCLRVPLPRWHASDQLRVPLPSVEGWNKCPGGDAAQCGVA